jgi:hypothetical protein
MSSPSNRAVKPASIPTLNEAKKLVHYLTDHEKGIVFVIEDHIQIRGLFLPSDMSIEEEGAASAVPTLNPKSVILF